MRRDEALTIIRAHWPELQEMGVLSISLFGPIARDEGDATCEVDILVEVRRPMGLAFFGIERYLEELLGRSVILVTPESLSPEERDQVLSEAVRAA